MRRKSSMIAYLIFGLVIVGIISQLFDSPQTMLIPLLVFGIVFYLYKFPPGSWRSRSGTRPGRFAPPKSRAKKKTTFRVIRGNKRDDDEPPRFH